MSDANRDQNHVPVALGQSSTSATTTLPFLISSTTGRLLTDSASGSGDVVGPASATDNAVVLFDGATGKLVKNSTIKQVTTVFSPTISDGVALGSGTLMWSDLFLASGGVVNWNNGNITLTHSAGNITLAGGTLTIPTSGLIINATTVTSTGTQLNYLSSATGTTGTTSTNVVFSTSPTLTTPVLGVATATSINGLIISTSTGTLTITNLKTLAVTNTLTLSGTDSTVMTFPTTSATIARTDAGNTFTGVNTLTSPVIVTSIDTSSTSFTVFAGATTLMTIGGTGASASSFFPSTLDTSSSITGAIRTSGGISAAKALNIGTTGTFGGNIILGANSITMTGSIAATGARVTKIWTADIESTNMPTVGGIAILTSLTAPQFTTIELGNASDTTLSRSAGGVLAVEGVVIPSISSTNTLTNKRVTRRIVTVNAPGATPTTNADNNDIANFTGLGTAITSMTTNLSGTPADGDLLEFRFLDDGTARAITWGTSFAATTVALPTTTVISTTLRVLFEWRAASSKWECVATA